MGRKSLLAITTISMLLVGCGTSNISSSLLESSAISSNSSLEPILSVSSQEYSSISKSSISSSSKSLTEQEIAQSRLDEFLSIFKSDIGLNKTFTIKEDERVGETKRILDSYYSGEVTSTELSNEANYSKTISHNGEDGTGFYNLKCTLEEEDEKTVAIEKSGDSYNLYDSASDHFFQVDSEYLYNEYVARDQVGSIFEYDSLEISYFDQYQAEDNDVKAWIGEDLFKCLSLKDFSNNEYKEKDGNKEFTIITGTKSSFNGSKVPSKPTGRTYYTAGTFDCQYTLTLVWNDDGIVSFSSLYSKSYTQLTDDLSIKQSFTHCSYQKEIVFKASDILEESPLIDKNGLTDNGNISSTSLFVMPLKDGSYEYASISGLMGDAISSSDILSKSAFESGIGINIYEDINKKKKVDLDSLKLKSYSKTYYVDFAVPNRTSYVIMETAIRKKSDISKGDISFKSVKWSEYISGPLASWMPEDYVIVGYPESTYFATTELVVLASNDKLPTINSNKMSLKGGCYYVIRNCADEK